MSGKSIFAVCIFTLLTSGSATESAEWKLPQMFGKNGAGERVYRARPVDDRFKNLWPEEYEQEFQGRARKIIAAQPKKLARGSTYFENEKRFYGTLMAQVLGEFPVDAMKGLQERDHQADVWHRETDGIDYYACFTLKHQMRKYFYFGDLMDSDYRRRMFTGGKKWTAKDPYRRPHYAYKKPQPGWGPDAKNSWVDVRNTENLFLMRVTSVYLMAEETGNEATTAKYKDIILNYTKTLYRIGIGEWDSENYHGHSIGPLCNLYDFSKDGDVKLAAKACLDWFMAAGAVKYYRGGFNGPGSRDYNHAQPFGGSAASMLWVYFGDTPRFNSDHLESDEVHLITSAYRPPVAVMKLARKKMKRPVELFASKPEYNATTTANIDSQPQYLETQFIGNTFQLGSLSCGTPPGVSAVNGFKILVKDRKQGCQILHAAPGTDPNFAGSPIYQKGKINAQNRVAQYKNLAIWLAKEGKSPWLWVVPNGVNVSEKQGITFLECDETWIAVTPLGIDSFKNDESLTQQAREGKRARFADHVVLASKGQAKSFCGMAVEIGEKQSHKNFAAFQKHVLATEVDQSKLDDGIVQYRSRDGKALGFHWQDDPKNLGVWRNGKRHDWRKHAQYLYATESGELAPPIFSKSGEGTLYVEADGHAFASRVDRHGKVAFHQGTPERVRAKLATISQSIQARSASE